MYDAIAKPPMTMASYNNIIELHIIDGINFFQRNETSFAFRVYKGKNPAMILHVSCNKYIRMWDSITNIHSYLMLFL